MSFHTSLHGLFFLYVAFMQNINCTEQEGFKQLVFEFKLGGYSDRPIFEKEHVVINFTVLTWNKTDVFKEDFKLIPIIKPDSVAKITNQNIFKIRPENYTSFGNGTELTSGSIEVQGVSLGFAEIKFLVAPLKDDLGNITYKATLKWDNTDDEITLELYDKDEETISKWYDTGFTYKLTVLRRRGLIDNLFLVVIYTVVVTVNVSIGCHIEISDVKKHLKKPLIPIAALCCQFLFMPAMSYGMIRLFDLKGSIALGYFAMGCAPGGGLSNKYSHLLGGDLSLSVTLTTISVILSLGMTTLWMLTLGQYILSSDSSVQIPFKNIGLSLLLIAIPVGVGFFIKCKKPLWAAKVSKVLKMFFGLMILIISVLGTWVNWFIFKFLTLEMLVAGCLLPYAGFIFGAVAMVILKQPYNIIVTVAIETGIQNMAFAVVLLLLSLGPPESDLAIIGPATVVCFTPIPLWVGIIIYSLKQKIRPTLTEELKVPNTDLNEKMLTTAPSIVKKDSEEGAAEEEESWQNHQTT